MNKYPFETKLYVPKENEIKNLLEHIVFELNSKTPTGESKGLTEVGGLKIFVNESLIAKDYIASYQMKLSGSKVEVELTYFNEIEKLRNQSNIKLEIDYYIYSYKSNEIVESLNILLNNGQIQGEIVNFSVEDIQYFIGKPNKS